MTRAAEPLEAPFAGMVIETGHVWGPLDCVGGLPCLDFTNTAGGHTKIREVERIPSYADALNWAVYTAVITPEEARTLLATARAKPREALLRVRELQGFREALHRMVAAIATGQDPARADFVKVREILARALAEADLGRNQSRFVWSAETKGLGTLISRVALAAHDMLSHENPAQLRQCERCTWLFIDRTKNQKRRFCRQDACGNKARAERFYRRKKAG